MTYVPVYIHTYIHTYISNPKLHTHTYRARLASAGRSIGRHIFCRGPRTSIRAVQLLFRHSYIYIIVYFINLHVYIVYYIQLLYRHSCVCVCVCVYIYIYILCKFSRLM